MENKPTTLQQKKNAVRKALKERGILKREGQNDFDHYKYFSEAQYKLLFTELFSDAGIEMQVTTKSVECFDVENTKNSNGRRVVLEISLIDKDSNEKETSTIVGEGFDKGDKGIYKAYTGAVKYFLADTFLVATGDDAEAESPDGKDKSNVKEPRKASERQLGYISQVLKGETLENVLKAAGVKDLKDLTMEQASKIISAITERKKANE